MNRLSLISIVPIVLALTGCATADSYRNTPTSKLCIDYLSLPSMNLNHGARAEELARRGENCNQYMNAAAARRSADAAFDQTLRTMQQSNPTPTIPMPIQTTCRRVGQYTNCTTN
jgi:hypothetical protein